MKKSTMLAINIYYNHSNVCVFHGFKRNGEQLIAKNLKTKQTEKGEILGKTVEDTKDL
ncbi:MAG: hypothetical protein IKB79_03645 [Oscillospiraceae bacterium]|nr:hypothetical protein [Oscillospiraceae bacterium]